MRNIIFINAMKDCHLTFIGKQSPKVGCDYTWVCANQPTNSAATYSCNSSCLCQDYPLIKTGDYVNTSAMQNNSVTCYMAKMNYLNQKQFHVPLSGRYRCPHFKTHMLYTLTYNKHEGMS